MRNWIIYYVELLKLQIAITKLLFWTFKTDRNVFSSHTKCTRSAIIYIGFNHQFTQKEVGNLVSFIIVTYHELSIKIIFSRALLKALAIGTLIACLTINSSKQKSKQKTKQHSETSAIQNSFSNIQYFKESSSIFYF